MLCCVLISTLVCYFTSACFDLQVSVWLNFNVYMYSVCSHKSDRSDDMLDLLWVIGLQRPYCFLMIMIWLLYFAYHTCILYVCHVFNV